jgi:hypothetical protein
MFKFGTAAVLLFALAGRRTPWLAAGSDAERRQR